VAPGFEDAFVRAATGESLKIAEFTYVGGTDMIFNSGAPLTYLDLECDGAAWYAVPIGGNWSYVP